MAVGEVLRRFTSKVLQTTFSDKLLDVLAPSQLGVGVRGATEQIGRKLGRLLQAQPHLHVLQIDLSNAFNNVDRQAIQRALSQHAPELLSWFEFTHGQASPLFCHGEGLYSKQGYQRAHA